MSPRSPLQNHGVIAHTRSRLSGILSFLLAVALFAAALLLAITQAPAEGLSYHDCYAQLLLACKDT
jgi:hypothetical protein